MHINAVYPSSPNSLSSLSEDDAASKIQAGWKGYRVRKQLKNSRKSKSNQQNGHNVLKRSSENMTIEEKSATTIQKTFRGFKIRKELKNAREAATKIQAGFRGYCARKELKKESRK
jgi:myosin heavy subunit